MTSTNIKIASIFNKITPKMTNCPICNKRLPFRDINQHLDSDECKPCFQSQDEEILSPSQNTGPESSPSKAKVKISGTIFNSPKKFGGLDVLSSSSSQEIEFSSLSPKRKRSKNGNSPFSKLIKSDIKRSPAKLAVETSPNAKHVPFTQSRKSDPFHIPYYVSNFEFILRCVIVETDDRELFNEREISMIEKFQRMDLNAKKLYVRLFQRKHSWFINNQIKYEEVHDLSKAILDLQASEFLCSGNELTDLEMILKLLSLQNIKILAKEMNLSAKGFQKMDFVNSLLQHSKQKTVFFNQNKDMIVDKIRSKALKILGDCVRVSEEPRKIFLRVLSLFSLSNWWDERESETGQQPQQLTTLLLVNQGKMTFPAYEIIRSRKIFQDRDMLLQFEECCAFEAQMGEIFEKKDWKLGLEVLKGARDFFEGKILTDEVLKCHVQKLPTFLRKFTSGSVMSYVLTKGVEVLERNRLYSEAVNLLKILINQDLYLPDYHGHWYERLVLDLDQHLKMHKESLDQVGRGLVDSNVRFARKLALCQRVNKICGSKKNADMLKDRWDAFKTSEHWISPNEVPSQVIKGKMMPKDKIPGARTIFLHEKGEDQVLCSVEEYVKEVYKDQENLDQGLHAEGAVLNTICAFIFWDALYEIPVQDAFRSPNQARPLDFDTDDFYQNRKSEIDSRLQQIEDMSDDQLQEEVKSIWDRYFGIVSYVNWDLFHSSEHILGLMSCFSRKQLRLICDRLIKNHRFTRSGVPDLTLWNPETKKVVIIEVKGPNDRLSNKQILWINYLVDIGINSFVCNVEAVGGKFLTSNKESRAQDLATANTTGDKLAACNGNVTSKKKRKRAKLNDEEDFL